MAGEVDLSFLPQVYDIIKSTEKDGHDVNQKVNELKSKLQRARDQIEKLPGIEYNKDEQIKKMEIMRSQLQIKTDLLQKYKSMYNFEIPK